MKEDDIDQDEVERLKAKVRVDPGVMKSGRALANFMREHEAKELELKRKYGSQYAKEAMRFTLNRAENAVVEAWVESLRPEILELQKGKDPLNTGEPYYGAIGGGLTYSFIPTGLGMIITVKESITGKELNVSDALEWFFFG